MHPPTNEGRRMSDSLSTHGGLSESLTERSRTDSRQEGKGREGSKEGKGTKPNGSLCGLFPWLSSKSKVTVRKGRTGLDLGR
jgi:hypothetical protein